VKRERRIPSKFINSFIRRTFLNIRIKRVFSWIKMIGSKSTLPKVRLNKKSLIKNVENTLMIWLSVRLDIRNSNNNKNGYSAV
jgi:hypothetical protein